MIEKVQQSEVTPSLMLKVWWAGAWRSFLMFVLFTGSLFFFVSIAMKVIGFEKKTGVIITAIAHFGLIIALSIWKTHFTLTRKFKGFQFGTAPDSK